MDNGWSLHRVAWLFITADEFALTYGQPDNRAFVAEMYRNVLDREGEPLGVEGWTRWLDTGAMDRASVASGFSESHVLEGMVNEPYVGNAEGCRQRGRRHRHPVQPDLHRRGAELRRRVPARLDLGRRAVGVRQHGLELTLDARTARGAIRRTVSVPRRGTRSPPRAGRASTGIGLGHRQLRAEASLFPAPASSRPGVGLRR